MMINVFFKEIKVVGSENIDMMILAYCRQKISFLVAMKAMRTPIVSWVARKMKCIAVERPQDLAKPGIGKIKVKSGIELIGVGTQFKKELMAGDMIKISCKEQDVISNVLIIISLQIPEQVIDTVISDTELKLKNPGVNIFEAEQEYSFKVIPKLDQTHVYESVIDRLVHGQSIGIFPEGGSHDRTEMLPIKAGVSIMALGAMAKDPNCKIAIIACGLKYFKPHKFRSQVIVEFSRPYRIPQQLVEKYKKNKREACGELLAEVERKMRDVTLNAPSYRELQQVYMARDIYMPRNPKNLTKEQINDIQNKFCKGFNTYRHTPELQELLQQIDDYMKELRVYNIHDYEVKTIRINFFRIMINFIVIIPIFLLYLSLSIAGLCMLLPLGVLNNHLGEKARKQALASSTVKVIGIDVVATKKLSTTIMLYPLFCIGFSSFFFFILGKFDVELFQRIIWTFIFFLFFPIYSYFCILSRDKLIYYYQLMQSRLLCLFYTEDMFLLIQMRKNLKKKVIEIVDKLAPELFQDFNSGRHIKRRRGSSMDKTETEYQNELELTTAFESLKELGI
eukprot:403370778